MTISLILAVTVLTPGPFWTPITTDPELQKAIGSVESIRDGKKTDFDRLTVIVDNLMAEIEEPERRGILLFHVVNVYAQSGMQHRPKMMEYVREADQLLKEPTRRAALHTFAGDASRLGVKSPPDANDRQDAAKWYLKGLKEVMDRVDVNATPQPAELPMFYDTGDNEADIHNERVQLERISKREYFRIMNLHSEVLRNQVTSMYAVRPLERDRLAAACNDVFHDENLCNQLLADVPNPPGKAIEHTPSGISKWVLINVAFVAIMCLVLLVRLRSGTKQ